MSKIYAEAITEIERSQYCDRDVLFEIIRKSPSAYVQAIKKLRERDNNFQWKKDCIELMRAGQLIPAIKLCREKTGKGLKEAKDYVESLQIA